MQDVNVSIANELPPFSEVWSNNVFLINFHVWIDNWFAHGMIVQGDSFSFQFDTMAKNTDTIMVVLGGEAKQDCLGMNFQTGRSLVMNVATTSRIGKTRIGGALGLARIHMWMQSVSGTLSTQLVTSRSYLPVNHR